MRKLPFTSKLSAMTVSILLLSACGGGGSSSAPTTNTTKPTPPTTVTPPASTPTPTPPASTPVATTPPASTPAPTMPPEIANPQRSEDLTATGVTTCGNDLLNGLACDSLTADFKGLQQDGEAKAGKAMSYKVLNQNGHECVQDLNTGLIWEQKSNDGGIHDVKHTYTWYSDDKKINGGVVGTQSGGVCSETGKCDTKAFIDSLNTQKYCGYSDWRLPEIGELYSLADYSKTPALNSVFTHTTNTPMFYWTSTLDGDEEATDNEYVYTFDFAQLEHASQRKKSKRFIRAVRSN